MIWNADYFEYMLYILSPCLKLKSNEPSIFIIKIQKVSMDVRSLEKSRQYSDSIAYVSPKWDWTRLTEDWAFISYAILVANALWKPLVIQ